MTAIQTRGDRSSAAAQRRRHLVIREVRRNISEEPRYAVSVSCGDGLPDFALDLIRDEAGLEGASASVHFQISRVLVEQKTPESSPVGQDTHSWPGDRAMSRM
jgi:hypothetical protein